MFSIIKKEISGFFSTPVGYIVVIFFLLSTALLLWVVPGEYNVIHGGYATLESFFFLSPILLLFLSPAITMRLIAEERQQATLELLLSRPISIYSILIGKFLAALILFIIALLPTIIWFITIYMLAEPVGNVDLGAYLGSMFGLILLGTLFVSIGLFASSVSKNQLVSFLVAILLTFTFYYGFDLLSSLFMSGDTQTIITNFGIAAHYKSLSRGVVDSSDLFYFVSLTVIFICLSKWAFERIDKK